MLSLADTSSAFIVDDQLLRALDCVLTLVSMPSPANCFAIAVLLRRLEWPARELQTSEQDEVAVESLQTTACIIRPVEEHFEGRAQQKSGAPHDRRPIGSGQCSRAFGLLCGESMIP